MYIYVYYIYDICVSIYICVCTLYAYIIKKVRMRVCTPAPHLVIDFRQTPIIHRERFNGWHGTLEGYTRWLRKRQVFALRNHIKTFRLKNSAGYINTSRGAHSEIPLFFRAGQPARKSYTNLRPLCLRFAKPVKGVCAPATTIVFYALFPHPRGARRWF